MEFVPIVQRLWRRRLYVALGALLAVAAGLVAGPGQPVRSGAATARVVLDTPDSQAVYTDPGGADSLQWRTKLLAHLVGSEPTKARMGRALGVRAGRIAVDIVHLEVPELLTTLPVAAADLAMTSPEPYGLVVRYDEMLPIISIAARGPDRRAAARLADAATGALQAAGTGRYEPELQGFVVDRVGPTRSREVLNGGGPKRALAIAAITFFGWLAGVAMFPRALSVRLCRWMQPA